MPERSRRTPLDLFPSEHIRVGAHEAFPGNGESLATQGDQVAAARREVHEIVRGARSELCSLSVEAPLRAHVSTPRPRGVSAASLGRQAGSPLTRTSSPRPLKAGGARHPSRRLAAVALTVSFVTPSFFVLRAWAQRWSTSDVTMVPQQKGPGARDLATTPPQAGRPAAEHAKASEPAARPVTRSVARPELTSSPEGASAI